VTGPLDGLDPVAFAAALSQLPPTHELVAAARAAVDVADGRAANRAALSDAAHDLSAECRGAAMATTMTRATLAARADIDGPARVERFDRALTERDKPPPASDPAGTAAAVGMAREWADDHAAAHDARQEELTRWHADDQRTDPAAGRAAEVPEQAGEPAMERVR